jgi:hypothetical protein
MLQLEAVGGGDGFYLQVQGESDREGVLRFTMNAVANQVEGRLNLHKPNRPGDQKSFQDVGIPAILIFWEKAEQHNLPAEEDDEIDPRRVAQSGRMVSLGLMMLAR